MHYINIQLFHIILKYTEIFFFLYSCKNDMIFQSACKVKQNQIFIKLKVNVNSLFNHNPNFDIFVWAISKKKSSTHKCDSSFCETVVKNSMILLQWQSSICWRYLFRQRAVCFSNVKSGDVFYIHATKGAKYLYYSWRVYLAWGTIRGLPSTKGQELWIPGITLHTLLFHSSNRPLQSLVCILSWWLGNHLNIQKYRKYHQKNLSLSHKCSNKFTCKIS
jgi:hypothetical protein